MVEWCAWARRVSRAARAGVAWCHKGTFNEEMLKAFRNFLGYWLGFSVLFTVLSLWMWDVVLLHQTIGLGLLMAMGIVLIDCWQAWVENRRAARDLRPVGVGANFVDPHSAFQHTDTQTPGSAALVSLPSDEKPMPRDLKAAGITLGLVYLLGYWLYGAWYVWEHWSGFSGFGILYGFMRAIIWPAWVAVALV
jgi:hypothetical protein